MVITRHQRYQCTSRRMVIGGSNSAGAQTFVSHCVRNVSRLWITNSLNGQASIGGSVSAMFHLDYLSCFLTVLATILLARKSWIGLLVAIANSLIVCVIGLRTSQLGFIPANLFCICVYAFSMRPWLKERTPENRDQAQRQESLVISTHNGAHQKGLISSHSRSSVLK
jgi:hypothetical protein